MERKRDGPGMTYKFLTWQPDWVQGIWGERRYKRTGQIMISFLKLKTEISSECTGVDIC